MTIFQILFPCDKIIRNTFFFPAKPGGSPPCVSLWVDWAMYLREYDICEIKLLNFRVMSTIADISMCMYVYECVYVYVCV